MAADQSTLVPKFAVPKFAGHETFPLRYGWLKKAVDGIVEDAELFTRDDALVTLGVGKNMVRSIRHWALANRVLEDDADAPNNRGRKLRLTPLGKFVFGRGGIDPYLEEPASLWLLHWQLCSRRDGPTTWYWAFNQFNELEFTKERLTKGLESLVETNNWSRVAASTLRRDVDCFIRTYTPARATRTLVLEDTLDCPFVELRLIEDLDAGHLYSFVRADHPTLPSRAVAFATLEFWEWYGPTRQSLSFDELCYKPGSPGQVFKLSEDGLTRHLEEFGRLTGGSLGYDVTAGLRQVYRRKPISAHEVLRRRADGRNGRKS